MSTNDREVRERAYRLWIEAGRPEHSELSDWLRAKEELEREDEVLVRLGIPRRLAPVLVAAATDDRRRPQAWHWSLGSARAFLVWSTGRPVRENSPAVEDARRRSLRWAKVGILVLLGVLAGQIGLKIGQVYLEGAEKFYSKPEQLSSAGSNGNPQQQTKPAVRKAPGYELTRPKLKRFLPVYGVRRRLDDVYFWMLVALTTGCCGVRHAAKIALSRRAISPTDWSKGAPGWLWACLAIASLAIVYLGAAWVEMGTFFHQANPDDWTDLRAMNGVLAIQYIEGTGHFVAIAVCVLFARFGWHLGKTIANSGSIRLNPRLRAAAKILGTYSLTPVTAFTVYFVLSQVLTGTEVSDDELVALAGATFIYAVPFIWLYVRCRRLWRRRGANLQVEPKGAFEVHLS